MANSNAASIGRFSSQILTYLGTQRVVKNVTGQSENTFKYTLGTTVFPNPASLQQSSEGSGVVGNVSPDDYNSVRCYFLSRGAGNMFADSMTSIVIDMASAQGVSTQTFLEYSASVGYMALTNDSYAMMNQLRDPSHQIAKVTDILNSQSLVSREIRD